MYYKRFAVVGVVNVTTLDAGLVSLIEVPYHIGAILITVSDWQDNVLEGWIGTERILEIPDYLLDTDFEAAIAGRSTTKINHIPIDIKIPPGQIFKIGIRCGAAATNIFGAYEYTKTSP
ncbi:MAG TPA: hypothetical protein ENH82_10855 [bacterium]|nr:hypothetical protein [bacterium]